MFQVERDKCKIMNSCRGGDGCVADIEGMRLSVLSQIVTGQFGSLYIQRQDMITFDQSRNLVALLV